MTHWEYWRHAKSGETIAVRLDEQGEVQGYTDPLGFRDVKQAHLNADMRSLPAVYDAYEREGDSVRFFVDGEEVNQPWDFDADEYVLVEPPYKGDEPPEEV